MNKINKMKKRLILLTLILFALITPNIVSSAEITANSTSPTNVYTNTNWNLNLTIIDSDYDNLTGYVQFYINGTLNGSVQNKSVINDNNTLIGTLGSGNFSKSYNLTAEFWVGNGTANTTKENTTNVTVQNSLPTQPDLTYPNNNAYINSITLNWNASTDADYEDNVSYYVMVNGTQACYTTNLTCSNITSEGYYQWNVTAYDGYENGTTSESWFYTYDTTTPQLVIISTNNTFTNVIPSINGTAFDTNNNSIYTNDTSWNWNGNYTNWSFTNNTKIEDGNYHILITANDSVGNINNSLFNFTYDATPPQYSNVGKNKSFVDVNDNILFYANWSDSLTGLSQYIFSWNNNGTMQNDSAQTFFSWSNITKNITAASKSKIAWIIYANDSVGNWNNTGIQTFTVNGTEPIIIATAISPDEIYTNTDFKFNMTAIDRDNESFTGYVQFYINGTLNGSVQSASMNNITSTLIGILGSGNFSKGYNLTAEYWAGDGEENITKTNISTVIIQNSVPIQPDLTYPKDDAYINSITLNWTASTDTDGDNVSYYVMVNGTQACNTSNSSCLISLPSGYDGYYQWNVTPYDGTENGTTSILKYFTYDSTKPVITTILSTNITSSSTNLSVSTNEETKCSYSKDDISYSSMAIFDNDLSNYHSKLLSLSSSTSYEYFVRCKDKAGNIMSFSNSTSFTTRPSDNDGGGGGGTTTVTYEEKSFGTIAAGSSKEVKFSESDTFSITKIKIQVKNKVTNAKIKVDTTSLPSGASKPSTKGRVYKYIKITKSNLDNVDIEKAVIEFKVRKSWLIDKEYGKDAVSLHRYYNKKWEKLETERSGFDSNYYYYSAESPGFSTFSITAEKASPPIIKQTAIENITTEEPKKEIKEEEPEKIVNKESIFSKLKFNLKNFKLNIFWILTLTVIIGVLTLYLVQKKWNLLNISVGMESEAVIAVTTKMEKTEKFIKEGNIGSAKKTYTNLLKIYEGLPINEKKWVYKEIQSLYNGIKNKSK